MKSTLSLLLFAIFILLILLDISFVTLTQLRLYGHDIGIQIYPAHQWFLNTLRQGYFPYWFNAPRYTFPTLTAQFGQWFISPYIFILYLFNIDYSWPDIRFEFIFWRLIAFLTMYLYASRFTSTLFFKLSTSLLYISSGMYSANDGELVFLVSQSLIPWLLYSLSGFVFSISLFYTINLALVISALFWFGYHGVLLTAPMLFAPFIFYSVDSLIKGKQSIMTILFYFFILILFLIPLNLIKITETLTFPLFGTALGPSRSSLEGLYNHNALLSLFFPNPFYLPGLKQFFSNSLFLGPLPALFTIITSVFIIYDIIYLYFNKVSLIICTSPFLEKINRVFIVRLLTCFVLLIPLINYLNLFAISFLIFIVYLVFVFSVVIKNSDMLRNSLFEVGLLNDTKLSELRCLLCCAIISLFSGIHFPFTQHLHSFFIFPLFTRWQYINCDIYIIFSCISSMLLLSSINSSIMSLLMEKRFLFFNIIFFMLIILLPIIILDSDSISTPTVSMGLPSIISLLVMMPQFLVVFYVFYYMSDHSNLVTLTNMFYIVLFLLLFTVLCFFSIVYFLQPRDNLLVHNQYVLSFFIYYIIDSIPLLSAIFLQFMCYWYSSFIINNYLYYSRFFAIVSIFTTTTFTPIYLSHLDLGSVYHENNLLNADNNSIKRVNNINYDTMSSTIHSTTPAMWAIADTVPASRYIDAHAPNNVFRNIIMLTDQHAVDISVQDFDVDYETLREPEFFLCPDQTRPVIGGFFYRGNELYFNISTNCFLYIIFMDTWSAGWKSYIDNLLVPTFRVNKALRGIAIPSGHSVIQQLYEPVGSPYLQYLFLIFLFTGVGIIIYYLTIFLNRKFTLLIY